MAGVASIGTTTPIPSTPMVDPSGNITRPWLYFLLALFNRTGGAVGVSLVDIEKEVATLQQQATSLFVEESMSDVPGPAPLAPGALLTLSLVDDVPPAQINPFLASLLIADAP